ncbi:hypothetical protein TorRG33x02_180890 [Trema orientale]|uniref:Uncharacterized protein n=1 Tax=Trema orientale TaxID=63057 RepID=A0A2P5EKI5_TREOI|nr:hypothetical protein TorRG33x02_180890 [Trema orientale]
MLNGSCSGEIHQPSNTDTTDTSTVNLSNSWSSRQIRSHGRERINGGNIHKPSNEDATDASTRLYHRRWNELAGGLYDRTNNLGKRFTGGLYNRSNRLYNRSKLLASWLCSDTSMFNGSYSEEIHQPSNTDTMDTSTINLSNGQPSRQICGHGLKRINGRNIHESSNEDAMNASMVNLSDGQT